MSGRTRKKQKQNIAGKKRATTFLLIALIVGGGVGALFLTGVISGSGGWSPYAGGWEVVTGLDSIKVNNLWYSDSLPPEHYSSFGWDNMVFDVDAEDSGIPTLMVGITTPVGYVGNAMGDGWREAADGEVFDYVAKPITEDYVFFWDHHVFFFEVEVRAHADHEGQNWLNSVVGEASGMLTSQFVEWTLRFEFRVDPWMSHILEVLQYNNLTLGLDNSTVWAGVMSAQVVGTEGGVCEGYTDPQYPGNWRIDQANELNKFRQTGEPLANLEMHNYLGEETVPLDAPEDCLIEISGAVVPGWTDSRTVVVQEGDLGISVSDYYCQARIRVDVMMTAGYNLEDGELEDAFIDGERGGDDPIDTPFDDFIQWLGMPFAFLGLEEESGTMVFILIAIIVFIVVMSLLMSSVTAWGGRGHRDPETTGDWKQETAGEHKTTHKFYPNKYKKGWSDRAKEAYSKKKDKRRK